MRNTTIVLEEQFARETGPDWEAFRRAVAAWLTRELRKQQRRPCPPAPMGEGGRAGGEG